MILQNLETDELFLSSEFLANLPVSSLTELMLHRSSLYSAAIVSHIPDSAYLNSIQREITAIHDEIKSRE